MSANLLEVDTNPKESTEDKPVDKQPTVEELQLELERTKSLLDVERGAKDQWYKIATEGNKQPSASKPVEPDPDEELEQFGREFLGELVNGDPKKVAGMLKDVVAKEAHRIASKVTDAKYQDAMVLAPYIEKYPDLNNTASPMFRDLQQQVQRFKDNPRLANMSGADLAVLAVEAILPRYEGEEVTSTTTARGAIDEAERRRRVGFQDHSRNTRSAERGMPEELTESQKIIAHKMFDGTPQEREAQYMKFATRGINRSGTGRRQ